MSPTLTYEAPSLPQGQIVAAPPPGDNQRLGLHVTTDELVIWQDRAVNGPYKTVGDVSSNSPGDWDRIVTNKTSFMSNPAAMRWTGKVAAECWYVNPVTLDAVKAVNLLDAAFYALVQNDATVGAAVISELISQTGEAGTDFSDTTRWCLLYNPGGTPIAFDGYIHDYADWLIRLLYAYDYCKTWASGGNITTLDQWFLDAAEYMELIPIHQVEQRYPDRSTDNYSNYGAGWDSSNLGGNNRPIYYSGPTFGDWHEGWNNRAGVLQCFAGLVGVMQNNSALIANAKRYFEEYITYGVFFTDSADCHCNEYQRWVDGLPSQGWSYSVDMNTSMATLADTLARAGDYELYDYSTSTGLKGTDGGPKSLEGLITTDLKYVVPDITHYGTDQAGNQNATYRIDTQDGVNSVNKIRDCAYGMPNLYYNSSFVKTRYLRTEAGAPGYPSSNSEGVDLFRGPRRFFPGSLFMWGDLEGMVDPFP